MIQNPYYLKRLCFRIIGIFFILFFVNSGWPNTATLLEKAESQKLWLSPQWIRLLHYKKSLFGKYESEADGIHFFLSPQGKTNPHAELVASIQRLFPDNPLPTENPIDNDPRCRFPARKKFLARELGLEDSFNSYERCPKLKEFLSVSRAKSVSVIFSSYYLSNPSSAFGHSLLRLNRYAITSKNKEVIQNPKILDLGVNYAAAIDTENPILYVTKGMFGGFKGVFSTTPYYMKVREYADFESRDLWEYDLNLNEEETEFLVLHLWELDSTHFDYYFLFENCSYHVLTVLDAVRPSLNLQDKVPFYVIPIDTIKALFEVPELVHGIHFRPSLRSQFEGRKNLVPPHLYAWIRKISSFPERAKENEFQNLSSSDRTLILDAAIEYYDSKNQEAILAKSNPQVLAHRKNLLFLRSQEAASSEEIQFKPTPHSEPHLSHDSFRWGAGYLSGKKLRHRLNTEIRFALHDTLDQPQGFAPFSSLEFFNLKMSFSKNDVRLEDFRAIQAENFSSFNRFHREQSYSLKLGLRDYSYTKICTNCHASYFDGAWGFSFVPFSRLNYYLLGNLDLLVGPKTSQLGYFTFGVGPRTGFIYASRFVSVKLEAIYKWRPFARDPWLLTHLIGTRFRISSSWAIDLEETGFEGSDPRYKINLYHYF